MLVLRLGWRNLWRNPRRSLLTFGAIAVAFAIVVVIVGLVEGIARQLLVNGTRMLLGHVQIHASNYLPDRGLQDTIGGLPGIDVMDLLDRIEADGAGHPTPRVFGFGLLSTGERSAGAQMLGIDSVREARVSSLQQSLIEGTGLDTSPPMSMVLGKALAEELGATVGSEIAVVTQSADGTMGNDLFRVSGIMRTGLVAADRSLALLRIDDLQSLLALGNKRVHEIVVRGEAVESADHDAAKLREILKSTAEIRVDTWRTLAPQLVEYLNLVRSSNAMMLIIVGTFAAFGVLNTMLMAVFERTHEIGVLSAMGLRPRQILLTILCESLCLALVGLASGLLLGAAGIFYFATYGWDLSRWTEGVTIAGVLFDPVLRCVWNWSATAQAAATLTVVTVLAGLIPAIRAARLSPIEALSAPVE